jgi:hypothetical protein
VGIDESTSGGGLSDPGPPAAARSSAGVCEHAAITTTSATSVETNRVMDFILPPSADPAPNLYTWREESRRASH